MVQDEWKDDKYRKPAFWRCPERVNRILIERYKQCSAEQSEASYDLSSDDKYCDLVLLIFPMMTTLLKRLILHMTHLHYTQSVLSSRQWHFANIIRDCFRKKKDENTSDP